MPECVLAEAMIQFGRYPRSRRWTRRLWKGTPVRLSVDGCDSGQPILVAVQYQPYAGPFFRPVARKLTTTRYCGEKGFAVKLNIIAKFWMMIMGVCLLSAPAIADAKVVLSQDDKDQLEIIAQTLARCGGVYDRSSEFLKDTDPAPSLSAQEIADGAEISAAFLLMSTGIIPDWQNALKYAASGRSLEKARRPTDTTAGFHNYGVKIDPTYITC